MIAPGLGYEDLRFEWAPEEVVMAWHYMDKTSECSKKKSRTLIEIIFIIENKQVYMACTMHACAISQ